jgi:hypothetical protein
MKFLKCLSLLILTSVSVLAQETVSVGISGVHNFPMKSTGFGLRSNVPVTPDFSVVPQVKYTPKFNDIHEVNAGVSFHYNIIKNSFRNGSKLKTDSKKPVVYVAAGVLYNRWINYYPTTNTKIKKNNILPEAGLGLMLGGNKLRGFAEGKYNILWGESYAEAGILFYPFNKRSKKVLKCN